MSPAREPLEMSLDVPASDLANAYFRPGALPAQVSRAMKGEDKFQARFWRPALAWLIDRANQFDLRGRKVTIRISIEIEE